jgi:hypothetical protein
MGPRGTNLGPVQQPQQQPSAIATAPLDEPDGYRDGGDHGDTEQDRGCHRTNLSVSKLVIGRVPRSDPL